MNAKMPYKGWGTRVSLDSEVKKLPILLNHELDARVLAFENFLVNKGSIGIYDINCPDTPLGILGESCYVELAHGIMPDVLSIELYHELREQRGSLWDSEGRFVPLLPLSQIQVIPVERNWRRFSRVITAMLEHSIVLQYEEKNLPWLDMIFFAESHLCPVDYPIRESIDVMALPPLKRAIYSMVLDLADSLIPTIGKIENFLEVRHPFHLPGWYLHWDEATNVVIVDKYPDIRIIGDLKWKEDIY